MPDYPAPATTTRGFTFYSGIPASYVTSPLGYKQLFTGLAPGKTGAVETIWLQNNHATGTYRVSLSRVPKGWVALGGAVGDPLLRIFFDLHLKPGQLLTINATVGLSDGDTLWGYQFLDSSDVNDTSVGINVLVAGKVVG